MIEMAKMGKSEDERYRQEEEIRREKEERYRSLFETMLHGVVYQGDDGKVLDANPAALEILGLTLEQIQGRTSLDPCWRAIHEDGSEFSGEQHPSMVALRTGSDVHDVVMGIRKPQSEGPCWIKIQAIPQFRSGQAVPYQVYTTFEDITERKRAQEHLLAQRDLALRLGSSGTQRDAMECLLDVSLRLSGLDSGGIYLIDEVTGAATLVCYQGLSDLYFVEQVSRFEAESSPLGFLRLGEPGYWEWCPPLDLFGMGDLLEREGLLTMGIIPVKDGGEAVAALVLASHEQRKIRRDTRYIIEDLAALAGGTLARLRLNETIRTQGELLSEANTALKVLLKQRELDRAELEQSVIENARRLILPYIDRLKKTRLLDEQKLFLEILESHVKEIVSPFVHRVSSRFLGLTPTEISVAEFIRQGKSSKEIADLLGLAEATILSHRQNIRKKLGINQKKLNLRTYLGSLDE